LPVIVLVVRWLLAVLTEEVELVANYTDPIQALRGSVPEPNASVGWPLRTEHNGSVRYVGLDACMSGPKQLLLFPIVLLGMLGRTNRVGVHEHEAL
jgi:hypothetical protein